MAAGLIANARPVRLGGYISKAQAERAIVGCDYLVIPSRIESIPVVFSDAMKLGRPVVATPVGDFPNLFAIAGCGVLAESASSDAIAHALRQALSVDATSFSEGVSVHANAFDLKKIAQTVLAKVNE
jgi:glycosyltransferase involved in cell wall biosynthesis